MNRKMAVVLLASCVVWSTSGCASIFSPGPDFIPVSSKPSGAGVLLDGMPVGKTPLIVAVMRDSEGIFTFELPGYETRKVDRDKVLNGATLANALWAIFWPAVPIALIVDAATGNIGKYSTEPLNVELVPVAKPQD